MGLPGVRAANLDRVFLKKQCGSHGFTRGRKLYQIRSDQIILHLFRPHQFRLDPPCIIEVTIHRLDWARGLHVRARADLSAAYPSFPPYLSVFKTKQSDNAFLCNAFVVL